MRPRAGFNATVERRLTENIRHKTQCNAREESVCETISYVGAFSPRLDCRNADISTARSFHTDTAGGPDQALRERARVRLSRSVSRYANAFFGGSSAHLHLAHAYTTTRLRWDTHEYEAERKNAYGDTASWPVARLRPSRSRFSENTRRTGHPTVCALLLPGEAGATRRARLED